MHRFIICTLLLIVGVMLAGGTVWGQTFFLEPFDVNPTIGATQAANTWYVDRFAPRAFEMAVFDGGNRLRHSISTLDAALSRPGGQQGTFYNTQGRKYDLNNPVNTYITAQLYIASDWQTNHRRADMWATLSNGSTITAYPIIGFANTEGNNPTWRVWNVVGTEWINIPDPAGFVYGAWYTLRTELTATAIYYYINGNLVFTGPTGGSTTFKDIIIQAYNFGDPALSPAQYALESYDVYWDNIGAGSNIRNITQATDHLSIQTAINAAVNGDVIEVAPGTYVENVSVNKNVTLRSTGGTSVTTIEGISGLGKLGTIVIENNTSGFVLGGSGQGFTIIGIDNNAPGVENAAIYFKGGHTNTIIRGNVIEAKGDHGLATEYNVLMSGVVIDGNTFTGKTFQGANPAGVGFGAQFTLPNVPRQLVVMGGGASGTNTTNIIFTNNIVNGIAGGMSLTADNGTPIPPTEQGNNLVTIDADNSTITGNTFSGTTARFATSLRFRRPGMTFSGNIFVSTGLTPTTGHLFIQNNALSKTLVAANNFDVGSYVVGGTTLTILPGFTLAAAAPTSSVVYGVNGELYVAGLLKIQDAINTASAGETINVAAGSYLENLTVNKPVILRGANLGIACGSRVGESLIAPLSGIPVTVTADGVTIDGFEITAPSSPNAISAAGRSNLTIRFNNIHHVGTTGTPGNVHAIVFTCNANATDVTIADNCIDMINNPLNTASGSGIGVGFSTNINTVTNLLIERNKIGNVSSKTAASGGKGAYGIIINVGANPSFTGGAAIDAIVRNNDISNLEGLWAHAIGLEGQTPNALVENNVINNVIDHKSPSDAVGVMIEQNNSAATVRINNNYFTNVSWGIVNVTSVGPANGTCNWYGAADFGTVSGKVYGLVDFVPYLTASSGGVCAGGPVQVSSAGTLISGHTKIQPAIDATTTLPGYVITIAAGTYAENVTVNKAGLQLIGANAATTIVNGGGPGSTFAMNVTAAGVSISGMTFKNAQSGLVIAANNTAVRNSLFFENVGNGILIDNAAFNTIRGNTFHNNPGGAGVALVNAKQNVITANTFGGGSFANGKNISIAGTGVNPSRGNAIRANTFLAGSASSWYIYVESDPLTTSVNFNLFADSRTPKQYIYNSSATLNVNARYNWFDGITPPDASGFSGAVDRSFAFATDPTVSIFPESQYVSVGQPVTLDVIGLIPAGTEVKGSTIDMSWTNDAVIPDVSGPTDGGFFDVAFPVPGNPFFAVNNLSASSVRVDQSLLNNPGGVGSGGPMPYLRVFFSITFQPNASGTSVITLPTVTLRDPANAPITPVVILPAGGATLIADGDAPVVSDVLIDNTTLNTDQNSDTFDDFVKNTDGVVVTATVTDNNPLAAANIVADLTGLGGGAAVVADSYAGTLATWTLASVTCSPSDGTITVNVTATDVVSLTHTAGDNIIADNTPPTPPTAFVAKTDNTIGGHGKVALSWTAGTDTYGKSTVIRYNGWSYPTYPAGAPPAYPALPTDGSGITVTPMSATSHTHAITPRNIHYYSAFTLDWAGNYSAAPAAAQQDRAANYFLGDLGSGAGANLPGAGGYNGLVNFDDLIWFSGLYFSSSTSWNSTNNGAEADFGPTVANKSYAANHRFALPRPDGVINFEDLMIFSMNYMNTTPKLPPPADPQLARELAVELVNSRSTSQQGEILAVTVRLANDGREVKGVSTVLDFDPTKLQFIDASPAGLFGSDQQGFFFSSVDNGKLTLDAAMLGVDRTVNFSGNIATARFRVLHAGQGAATIAQAIVRSGKNTEEVPSLNNNAVALPTTFGLVQNYPNPFNPSTRIEYQVPAASSVTIEVFNVLGARIATLVNEVKDAGYHHVVWDGRNSANQQVASGIYFYTMTAGEFKSLKKMMLMK